MSKLEVDKITPQSGTTLTIGDAGDTTVINGLGTLPATIGTAAQVLSVNAGATGLQYGTAVTDLSNLNATNLTSGTVPDARFPSTLPTANGQNLTSLSPANLQGGTFPAVNSTNLTNLNATAITSGTLPDGRFPATLPAISGANLTNLPAGGKILQVVHFQRNGTTTVSSGSFVTTNITKAITPSASNSKILVFVNGVFSMNVSRATVFSGVSLRRTIGGTTTILQGDGNNDFLCNNVFGASNMQMVGNFVISDLDSPNTTSETTYEIFARIETSGEAIVYNNGSMGSVMTLMEVGA